MNFNEWAIYHAQIFGLISDQELAMIGSWQAIFTMCGYSIAELEEATNYLASGHSPKYRTEHLQAIHDRIKFQREKQGSKQLNEPVYSTCVLCSNSGSVLVPHPSVWNSTDPNYWRTCLLWCICGVGRSKKLKMVDYEKERFSDKKLITCLDEYEASYSRDQWQELIKRHYQMIKERNLASDRAGDLDKQLGEIKLKYSLQ